MEANYPITWNHRNHLIRRASDLLLLPPIPRPRRREQLHGQAITNKVLQRYRYLGQGRSIALDTVAYRAQVGLQLMVQFSRPRVRDSRVNPSDWNDEPVNRLPDALRQETKAKREIGVNERVEKKRQRENWKRNESTKRKIDEGETEERRGRGKSRG